VASREVLDLIDGLLDKSILVREEERGIVRYRMLETLRQYGHQRLDAAGESARVARAHRDWYVDLMIRFGQQWLGPDQVAWVHRMRIDNPNLRAAAEFSLSEPGESVVLARMGMASQQYWSVVGFQEGARVWIERALATMPEDAPEYGDTLWLCGLASLLRAQLPLAAERLTASGEIAQRTGNEVLGARVTTTWGLACVFGGDYERAVALLTPALATLEAHRVGESEFLARWQLGMAQGLGGDLDAARVTLADGLARSAECGEICFRGWLLNASAQVESAHGQLDAARSAALRALGLQRELGDLFALALTTSVLAFITVRHNEFTRAATLLGIAESLWTSIGATPAVLPVFGRGFARNRERAAEALGPERFANAMARGAAMTRDEGLRYALDEADPLVTVTDDESALLTKRETEVAELVADGLTNREIAAKLTIAPRTAETHVDHILTKLGFRTRTQVAGWVAARRLNR
jgi:non-specific serine/threonine protein kinase